NLRRNGATGEEIDFLVGGKRVELNAFMSDTFVNWIEGKLQNCGVKKIVSGDEVLAEAYRRSFIARHIKDARKGLIEERKEGLRKSGIPEDLRTSGSGSKTCCRPARRSLGTLSFRGWPAVGAGIRRSVEITCQPTKRS